MLTDTPYFPYSDLLRSLMTAKGIPLRRNQPGNPMVSGKRRREEQDDIRGEDISRSGPKRQNCRFYLDLTHSVV